MASTVQPNVVAVTDAHGDSCGAVVWWKLSGEVSIDRLAVSWEARGLDPDLLPNEPSPAKRIRRAVDQVARGMNGRCLVRPLAGKSSWAIVNEEASKDDLEYQIVLRARLEGEGLFAECAHPVYSDVIHAAYDHYRDNLVSNDVSKWLLDTMDRMRAVGLRQGGGIYFVPRERVPQLRQIASVLADVSGHEVYEVPALKSDEAVRAILHAVLDEADQELGRIEEEMGEREYGKRGLETRERRCGQLLEKVAEYEALLGESMDGIRDRAEGLRAEIVAATLVASMEGGGDDDAQG